MRCDAIELERIELRHSEGLRSRENEEKYKDQETKKSKPASSGEGERGIKASGQGLTLT